MDCFTIFRSEIVNGINVRVFPSPKIVVGQGFKPASFPVDREAVQVEMIICAREGKKMPKGWRFCPSCGLRLGDKPIHPLEEEKRAVKSASISQVTLQENGTLGATKESEDKAVLVLWRYPGLGIQATGDLLCQGWRKIEGDRREICEALAVLPREVLIPSNDDDAAKAARLCMRSGKSILSLFYRGDGQFTITESLRRR